MRNLVLLGLLVFASNLYAQKEFGFDNRKGSGQPYLSPQETVKRMQMAPGFECKLYAGEPELVNPIAMTVDERGRVWVVECFEYPKRTPQGKMPRDRIRILEDTDGDGTCDKSTIFAEGKDFPKSFHLASGIEVGNGGVYLGAPPYLWFLQDENGDDKADKFEILLSGFGAEDTHETLNTFQWGPDGALYGLHGVFTHSNVKNLQADGPETRMNAAVWRYDPKTKKFEIFAEGTSNPWGLDYRNKDGQYILACCVIPHLFHISEGGIYKRQAGQSFNPYTYGYINEICDHTFHRESGWAHAGLISLDTPLMPESYRNRVIFGSIHGCALKQNELKPRGSTYLASRVDNFLTSGDKNFRPINLRWGPNGEIFCIDWHDQNPCHQTLPDDWDYERGRVYRFQTVGLKTSKPTDYSKSTMAELIAATQSPNPYVARTALRLLRERRTDIKPQDEILAYESFQQHRNLVSLQAIDAIGALPKWIDSKFFSLAAMDATLAPMLIRLAERNPGYTENTLDLCEQLLVKQSSPQLRLQIAGFLQRLSSHNSAKAVLKKLMKHPEDSKDHTLPQMYWLAYQQQPLAKEDGNEIDWLVSEVEVNPIVREVILPRIVRRLASTGQPEAFNTVMDLLAKLPAGDSRRIALDGLIEATQGRQFDAPTGWLQLQQNWLASKDANLKPRLDRLSVTFRDQAAIQKALTLLKSKNVDTTQRLQAIRAVSLAKEKAATGSLLQILRDPKAEAEIRVEATRALSSFDQPEIAKELLQVWSQLPAPVRAEAVEVLTSRKAWGEQLVFALESKQIDRMAISSNAISRLQAFSDAKLNGRIEKVWGRLRATPAELTQTIDKMRKELSAGGASYSRGRKVFEAQCSKCHQFDGFGNEVGPQLDGAGRDVEYLLANILDPNRVIGAPYFMRTVNLINGKVESGLLHSEDEQTLVLKGENAVLKVIPKKDIEEAVIQEKSLMPEGLAYNMTVQDFRDLVRYLQASPFITEVTFMKGGIKEAKSTTVYGTFTIPEKADSLETAIQVANATKLRLMLSGGLKYKVLVNGSEVRQIDLRQKPTQPDQEAVELFLPTGKSTVQLQFEGSAKQLAIRLIDPNRLVRYE